MLRPAAGVWESLALPREEAGDGGAASIGVATPRENGKLILRGFVTSFTSRHEHVGLFFLIFVVLLP